jgi:hypothetical protein
VFYDGCNGARLGRVVSDEQAFKESNGSRNRDGLLENETGDVLWIPLDDNFPLDPECEGDEDEEDED